MTSSRTPTQILSTEEVAELLDISHRRVLFLCEIGRIVGARKLGHDWAIPADYYIDPPLDERRSWSLRLYRNVKRRNEIDR